MARIEDLRKLDDTPIERQVEALDDTRSTAWTAPYWETFVGWIDSLLDNEDDYLWAYGTLSGIRATVDRTRQVSEAQERAVKNIVAGGQERRARGEAGGGRRRYEGWSR